MFQRALQTILKAENSELKERLLRYENGVLRSELEENTIKLPKSFAKFYRELNEEHHVFMKNHPDLVEQHSELYRKDMYLRDLISELEDKVPSVNITLVMGERKEEVPFSIFEIEYLKKLGIGDLSNGIDKIVRM